MAKVSIVIPTYNQAALLHHALDSVRAQTEPDWEAIIVNNHSDDDTAAVVGSFDDPRLKLINFRNHGVIAASRNVGIREASAEWVAFLDSDDLWSPDKLARCLAVAGDDVDAVSHPETIVEHGVARTVTATATAARVRYRSLLFDGNCLSPSAILVRRAMLMDLGGFAEDPALVTAEDYDLWLRLAARGARFAFVDTPLADYTLHAANSSGAVVRHMEAGLTVLARHYAALDRRSLADAVRFRRARARVIYGAGRSCQRLGRPRDALGFFLRSLTVYPLMVRPFIAALQVGGQAVRPSR